MATCNECGKELTPGSAFCTYCGAPVSQEHVPAPSAHIETPVYTAPSIPPEYSAPPPPLAYTAPPIPSFEGSASDQIPERPAPMRINFINSFLSLVILGSLLMLALSIGAGASPFFLNINNLNAIFMQFYFCGMVAMAAVLSSRAMGPDLSIGQLAAFSGTIAALISNSGGSLLFGILFAVALCVVVGLLNGVLIAYAHIPAIVTTLLMGVIVRAVAWLLSAGLMLPLSNQSIVALGQPLGSFGLLAVAVAIAFLLILLTPLGMPTYKRKKKAALINVLAYMGSSLIAALAGIALLARLSCANPSIGSVYEPLILLVYGCAMGSRAMDNRFAPAFYSLLPALLYAVLTTVLAIMNVAFYAQVLVTGVLALVFILIAFLVRPELRDKLPALKK